MGIFDFLKKIIGNENEEIKKEKIVFYDIGNWTENKRKEIENRERKIFVLIQEKINALTDDISEKIIILKNVDIESKKAEEKFKSLTEEGRKKYLEFVEFLLINLNNLQEDKLEKIIKDTNKFFSDFNKSSHMSYERATILIGKEMGNIRERLKICSRELIKIFNENKDIINSWNALSIIKLKFEHFEKIEEEINEINKSIILLEREINHKEKENEEILEEIQKIKKSSEYLEYLEKLDKIKFLEGDLEKEINNLGQRIDFKALGSFYHIFEEEMAIVKSYRNNFKTNFQKDSGENILNLLNKAKLNTEEISEKINQIKNKRKEIIKEENEIQDKDKTHELSSKIVKIVLEISDLNDEKSKREKRREKLNINKEEIIHNIKNELDNIGVEIM